MGVPVEGGLLFSFSFELRVRRLFLLYGVEGEIYAKGYRVWNVVVGGFGGLTGKQRVESRE
jgi:hypothetical protein